MNHEAENAQVTVILVTYNSRDILPDALASLHGMPHVEPGRRVVG